MFENIETLLELHKQGTMAKASTVLRISQSAVSKRIAAMESYYGSKLIERSGRNVNLTDEALRLVERLEPLLVELRSAMSERNGHSQNKVVFGVSESILSSWGAAGLENVLSGLDLDVEYHSHRSPLVIEKVEAGIYDIGLCSGITKNSRSLISEPLTSEELVLVANSPKKFKSDLVDILAIEKSSSTWKAMQKDLKNTKLNPIKEIESFFSIGQLAKAGYGIGLVPIGVAEVLGVKKNCIHHLKPKLSRPVQIVYKKSKLDRPYFNELIRELKKIR